ncbi:hypothetical protein ACWEF6_29630 [Amycolatopsis sp. NPDC004772]
MTGAREVSVAARRLLVLAAAVAGFWLVSWLVSGSASAADVSVGRGVEPGLPSGVVSGAHGVVAAGVSPTAVGRASAVDSRVAPRSVAAARPVARAAGPTAVGVVGAAEPVTRAVASPVAKTAAAVVEPVSHVAAPAARVVGAVAEPVSQVAAPVTRAVGALGEAAAADVAPVTRAAGALVAPLGRAATAVVAPVTRAVVAPIVHSAEPILSPAKALLSPATKAVTGLVDPVVSDTGLTSVVKPVTGDTPPVVNPVAGRGEKPLATEAPLVGSIVRLITPLAVAAATGPLPNQARQLVSVIVKTAGRTCVLPSSPRPHRTTAHHAAAGHRSGQTPVHPGAPVSSPDVATGTGSVIPPAFLSAGQAPHHFRASPWAHGDFVPLWRPCEPGTGPG